MDPVLIKSAAALRHIFQVKKRLRLEFLAGLSKLLRDFEIDVDDSLLASIVLAEPDELLTQAASLVGPQPGDIEGTGPQPGGTDGTGPQPGGTGGTGPQPGDTGGTGPQPGGTGGTGPQPGGTGGTGPQPGGTGGTGPQP